MRHVAQLLARVVEHIDDDSVIEQVRGEIMEICEQFPLWY
jgi:glycine hydroxymethyltransferase